MQLGRGTPTVLLATAILVCGGVACYDPSDYRGDGRLLDRGWRSYRPRFVIELPELSLTEPGTYRYTLAGAPRTDLVVHLNVVNSKPANTFSESEWSVTWETLQRIGTEVRLDLRGSDGEVVCQAEGRLAGEWTPAGRGVPDTEGMTRSFWHRKCMNARLASGKAYDLMIRVNVAESRGVEVLAKPTLEGGGRDYF